jgi:simple sugar transport system ATP-binding protein
MNVPMPAGVEPLVETLAVSKRYGTTLALDAVSLSIHAGHSVALAGRNGAGKSTLVRMLTGLDRPDTGEVRFAGAPAPDISARGEWRSRVACVYQKSTIIPDLTVGENLFLNDEPRTRFGHIRWSEVRRLGGEQLRFWGLDVDTAARAGDLTVGQRQLLEIARALRQGSRFIILDEPTARLESREIRQLFEHINRLKASGITFLFISHHLQEIYEICERVAVMRDGKLVAEASVSDMNQEAVVAAMVGSHVAASGKTGHESRSAEAEERRASLAGRPVVLDVADVSVGSVVDKVSFSIRAGERVGLAGLAGSGKTELAEAIVGARSPDAGRITVAGERLRAGRTDYARDIGIGYVPEDRHFNGFCSNLSVEENIALPVLGRLSSAGFVSPPRRRDLALSMISRLQIKVSDPDQLASELSGGNQQKTVMGRALAIGPRVLVLAYPTAGVDIASKEALFGIIGAADSAVLLVSDEIDELSICDRVIVMFAGRVTREFTGSWREEDMVAAMEGVGR